MGHCVNLFIAIYLPPFTDEVSLFLSQQNNTHLFNLVLLVLPEFHFRRHLRHRSRPGLPPVPARTRGAVQMDGDRGKWRLWQPCVVQVRRLDL